MVGYVFYSSLVLEYVHIWPQWTLQLMVCSSVKNLRKLDTKFNPEGKLIFYYNYIVSAVP